MNNWEVIKYIIEILISIPLNSRLLQMNHQDSEAFISEHNWVTTMSYTWKEIEII